MKKLISILSAICMVVTMMPFSAYAADITPEISLEEFTSQLKEMQAEYNDGIMFSEIIIEDDSGFCHIDGEEYPVSNDLETTVSVSENDISVPQNVIEQFFDFSDIDLYSDIDIFLDRQDLENLGFEIEIESDKATLTQPYQTKRLIVNSKYNINPLDSVAIVEGYNDLHIVQFDNEYSAKQAEKYYRNQSFVDYVEPDLIVSTTNYFAENISTYSNSVIGSITYDNHLSWGSENIGIDDYVDYLGDVSTLPEIVVGIIDTGIDIEHEFLQDRIIPTGVNYSDSGTENSENDDNGHGSHVAGIVVDNTTDNVKIRGYKCLNSNGSGSLTNVMTAIYRAIEDNVNVINMSLGAKGNSDALNNAVTACYKKNIVVCVSAGNSGSKAEEYTPANIESAITIAALDAYCALPYWTNYGDAVDILAPGVSIYSTYKNNGYETLSGTSMATPFVTAASALLISNNPSIKCDKVCDDLRLNGKHIETDWRFNDAISLYIGNLTESELERTTMPTLSIGSGKYLESIMVEINCDDENAEIYYAFNGTRADQKNGILYTGPITIDKATHLSAIAYSPGKMKSLQVYADYYITYFDDESNFEIDSSGIITAYNGTNNYLTVPDEISGITVRGIGKSVFHQSDIEMIKLPDTLTFIDDYAFQFCFKLYSVDAKNIEHIGYMSFKSCYKLELFDFSSVKYIGDYAFNTCRFLQSVYAPKAEHLGKYSFSVCERLINVDFPSAISIDTYAFGNCPRLQKISASSITEIGDRALRLCKFLQEAYFPKLEIVSKELFYSNYNLKYVNLTNAKQICENAFNECNSLEILCLPNVIEININSFSGYSTAKCLFAPNLVSAKSLPQCDNINIYLSNCFYEAPQVANSSYNIIAPSGSYAQQWANENGHTFIPCDSRDIVNNKDIEEGTNVRAYGRSIRVTNTGLRFGFSWNEIPEIEDLAEKIEYGFIYHYNYDNEPFTSSKLTIDNVGTENIKKKAAVNLDDTEDGKTTFNLVFTNIPDTNQNTNISVRAYVCIDGMYFYSNTLNGSFSEVARLVLSDDNIDIATKNSVKKLLVQEV